MGLEMTGHIDAVFKSVSATRTTTSNGEYVDGIWIPGVQTSKTYTVNIQPATEREIDFLSEGGERIVDARRVYVNNVGMDDIDQTGQWSFLGQIWKAHRVDNRPWRNYCKIIVSRIDDQ